MAGRGRRPRRLRRLIAERNDAVQEHEHGHEFDVPVGVLESILSRLSLKDNIRSSLVSTTWLAAAISVRRVGNPWLVRFPESGSLYEFYDPVEGKLYHLNLPKLEGCKIYYSKDEWLLCVNLETMCVFIFNPYTQELINFPKLTAHVQLMAFSARPTSPDCILFAIRPESPLADATGVVIVNTCRRGDTEWTTVYCETARPIPYLVTDWDNIVFCDGQFFCMSYYGGIGVYTPGQQAWRTLHIVIPPVVGLSNIYVYKRKFMAERNGNIYVVYPGPPGHTVLHILNLQSRMWDKVEDFGGATFFGSSASSYVRTDVLGNMRDRIYLPKIDNDGKRCVTYSLRDNQYSPEFHRYYLEGVEYKDKLWIDAPKDLSIFTK